MRKAQPAIPVRPPILTFWHLLLLIASVVVTRLPVAHAADYVMSADPPSIYDAPSRETAAMKLGIKAAPWLPRIMTVLQAKRPPVLYPRTIALFTGIAGQRYLAVLWERRHGSGSRLEFHKVVETADGHVRLRYLRGIRNWGIDLIPPSGIPIFAGEPTVAVVNSSGGGSAAGNYEIRMIQMKRNTVDITPDWAGRVVDVADIDGDGRYEVVAMDDRWTGFFETSGAAGPFLPVVLDRVDGRFVPSCRKYAASYRRWNDLSIQDLADPSSMAPYRAEDYASVLLAYAQIGALADARRAFTEMMNIVEDREHMPDWVDPRKTRQVFSAVLNGAEKYADAPCPVSAANVTGGHFGAEAVIEHFRFAAPDK